MELFVFARFHVAAGNERAAEEALHETVAASGAEAGCVFIRAFRSTRDTRLFYIHPCWKDEAAFELHAGLPHTVRFLARMEALAQRPCRAARNRSDTPDGFLQIGSP